MQRSGLMQLNIRSNCATEVKFPTSPGLTAYPPFPGSMAGTMRELALHVASSEASFLYNGSCQQHRCSTAGAWRPRSAVLESK